MGFFQEFLANWQTVGAVAPTSRFAQHAMLDPIDFSQVRVAVELGPGTGCITRAILGRLAPDACLMAVEINPRFVAQLRTTIPDSRLRVVEASAVDLPATLEREGLGEADCIVCSIPFANLPLDLRDGILAASRASLRKAGRIVAIQYTPLILPPLLKRHFGSFHRRFCLLNVPPALIFVAARS